MRGVGHPEESLSDVRCPDARSAQIGSPDSIVQFFQVKAYSGEPRPSSLCRNLFSKDNWRSALLDEAVELGPEVSFIGLSAVPSSGAEGLAGAGACPNRFSCRPPCEGEGEGPAPDSGKEVALGVPSEV